MRKRLQIFFLLLLPCLALAGVLGRGSPPALTAASDAAIPVSADNWGLSFPEEGQTPVGNATAEFLSQYDAWYVGDTSRKVIYLTFDCGYENGNTADILDILKEKNVKAVFFVTGHYCKTNPELVQRMIDEGHIVGNHSMNHPNFTTITPEEMYEEVKELHDYVQENFDYTMFLFRYPEGVFSEQSLAVLQDAGYQTPFWSYAYNDWDQNNQPDPDTAYQKVTGALHPGAIYLLHAVSETNSEILGDFIDEARSQGYEVSVYNIPPVENPREGASASSQTESSSESQTESQSGSGTEAE